MKIGRFAVMALVIACAACSQVDESKIATKGGVGDERMNMQEAAERADSILDATVENIKPAVKWVHGETSVGSCDLSRRRAVITVISEQRRGGFLGIVERGWERAGFRRVGVNASVDSPATYFETPDGFRVRLLIGGGGQAFFEVATPCVERADVQPPPTHQGSQAVGTNIPRPNIRSAFWSAGAP
ncbi:hypothetical protein [Streptomyces sp. bgisy091]|uniref:hypothetical protein n=1 Tax=Streptomyces sp. bgisy091 TaxID=3413778 RepID=UPI003D728C7B